MTDHIIDTLDRCRAVLAYLDGVQPCEGIVLAPDCGYHIGQTLVLRAVAEALDHAQRLAMTPSKVKCDA